MIWPIAIPTAAFVAFVASYDYLEGERLLHDIFYEYHLARSDIFTIDQRCTNRASCADIIVSLTTIPSRINFIAETLKSLMAQTRAPREIRLNLPTTSIREKQPYVIPQWLNELTSVKLVRCEDWGPATKLLPTVRDCEADQLILVVDDDRIYAPNTIEVLEAAALADTDAAFGLGGWIAPVDLVDCPTTLLSNVFQIPPAPLRTARLKSRVPVDILQGFTGYLVRPRFFDLDALTDYSKAPKAAFFVDDVWISAHCQVPKYVIPSRATNFLRKRRAHLYKKTSLGWINRGGGKNSARNNTIMLKYFESSWQIGGPAKSAPHTAD
jgi:hypothetical protein